MSEECSYPSWATKKKRKTYDFNYGTDDYAISIRIDAKDNSSFLKGIEVAKHQIGCYYNIICKK